MCRFARRVTGSTALGVVAGLLLSFDGLQLVLSRLALLDIFVAFFILCGVHCVVADRQWHRARLAELVPEQVTHGWGPVRGLLFRPWLLLGGLCWGLALGSKWEAAYPLAAFGLMCWLWSAGARRSFGVRWPVPKSVLTDGIPAFVHLVLVAVVVYVATWTGWLIHANQYEEHLSATQYTHYNGGKDWPTRTEPDASGLGEVTQSLRSLWYYHHDVYDFHTHFLNDSSHTYQSKPSGWLFLNRPVGVAADTDIKPGTQGCHAPEGSDCLRQVLLLGNPTIWWGGCVALLFAVVMWVGARDWRFGVAVVGTAATWLPWLQYDDRPIFLFYAIVTLPFVVLALTLTIGKLIGNARAPSPRRTLGVIVAGAYFVLALINFAWFWPIWTDQLLTHGEWLDRIWFSRWI
jgi:dolichyl-phosphate-mannose-protein mannosyltransferase